MTSASITVAVPLAAIFGALLLWALIYYTHRYIHQKCLGLTHWFHVLARREDFGNERADTPHAPSEERSRDRRERQKRGAGRENESRRREERRKDKGRREVEAWADANGTYKSGGEGTSQSDAVSRDRPKKWDEDGGVVQEAGRVILQPYPCVPAYFPAYVPLASAYVSWGVPLVPGPMSFPGPALSAGGGDNTDTMQSPQQRALSDTYQAEQPASSIQYECENVGESSSQKSPVPVETAGEPLRADFIEICDEYPEFVREDMERKQKQEGKQSGTKKTRSGSDDSSTSSSSSVSSVEEVPRVHIPTATSRPAFHFPQNHWERAGRLVPERIPTSYPRQW